MSRYRPLVHIFLLAASLFIAGCGYHVGDPGAQCLPFNTLCVKPVANESYAPQAQVVLTRQIVNKLQQSGVAIESNCCLADAVLEVTLIDYERYKRTSRENDSEIASSYNLFLRAKCSLGNVKTGECYFKDREIYAEVNALSDVGTQDVVYQDLPTLTEQLARKISKMVVSAW